MNNNTTWFEIFVTLSVSVFLILVVVILNNITNPYIDRQCATKGGQVFHTPGNVDSCIYPAK